MTAFSDLALSTMWNWPRAQSGEEMIGSIAEMGFQKVELNYQVRRDFLPAIEREIAQNRIQAGSIHSVFPKVDDERFNTDSVLLGYQDEDLRREAIKRCKESIDWAHRFSAKAVVFHPTEVPLDPMDFDRPLKHLIRENRRDTDEYRALFNRLLSSRQAAPYMAALKRSLDELCEYVRLRGYDIFLGMENRSMCHQIPIFSEFEAIMADFAGSPVKLWLDTGHAIMMTEIGLQGQALPSALVEHVIGVHIHDALNGRDHFPPGMIGESVLDAYLPVIKKAQVKVLELSSRFSADEVVKGAAFLLKKLNSL